MIMKKNFISYACVAAALVFASCQKEGPANDGTTVSPSDLDVVTATTMQTKTITQDGVNVLWENNDEILLWSHPVETVNPEYCEYKTTLQSPSSVATFVKDESNTNYPTTVGDNYIAFYLKNATKCVKAKKSYVQLALNKEQTANNGGDFTASIMIATSESREFTFQHLVSYIRFEVDKNTTPFKKLTVASADEKNYMVSRLYVDFASQLSSNLWPINPSNNAVYGESSKTVSITTKDGANFIPGVYYIAINPDTYAQGFKFTLEYEDGNVYQFNRTAEGGVVMTPGDVANIGTIPALQLEEPAELELGTVYTDKNGEKHGVVYWVDPSNPYKGKIISVSSEKMIWADKEWKTGTTNDNGLENYNKITGSNDYKNGTIDFKAIKYCAGLRETLGGEWYLPARGEWYDIYNAYYGLSLKYADFPTGGSKDFRLNVDNSVNQQAMAQKRKYDAAFALMGETTTATLDGDSDADGISGDNTAFGDANGVGYWTSKVNSSGPVQHVTMGVYSLGNNQNALDKQLYVRCIRDVSLL